MHTASPAKAREKQLWTSLCRRARDGKLFLQNENSFSPNDSSSESHNLGENLFARMKFMMKPILNIFPVSIAVLLKVKMQFCNVVKSVKYFGISLLRDYKWWWWLECYVMVVSWRSKSKDVSAIAQDCTDRYRRMKHNFRSLSFMSQSVNLPMHIKFPRESESPRSRNLLIFNPAKNRIFFLFSSYSFFLPNNKHYVKLLLKVFPRSAQNFHENFFLYFHRKRKIFS